MNKKNLRLGACLCGYLVIITVDLVKIRIILRPKFGKDKTTGWLSVSVAKGNCGKCPASVPLGPAGGSPATR